jgi:hypothetical protein
MREFTLVSAKTPKNDKGDRNPDQVHVRDPRETAAGVDIPPDQDEGRASKMRPPAARIQAPSSSFVFGLRRTSHPRMRRSPQSNTAIGGSGWMIAT